MDSGKNSMKNRGSVVLDKRVCITRQIWIILVRFGLFKKLSRGDSWVIFWNYSRRFFFWNPSRRKFILDFFKEVLPVVPVKVPVVVPPEVHVGVLPKVSVGVPPEIIVVFFLNVPVAIHPKIYLGVSLEAP